MRANLEEIAFYRYTNYTAACLNFEIFVSTHECQSPVNWHQDKLSKIILELTKCLPQFWKHLGFDMFLDTKNILDENN